MGVSEFFGHIRDPAPGFRCFDCRDRSESLKLLAHVSNILSGPATSAALTQIDTLLGPAGAAFKALYSHHDGLTLYLDSRSDAAGVEFYPIRRWACRSKEICEEFAWLEDHMPEWFRKGVAFGEIPHSGNYFLVATLGPDQGKIYYADHDAWEDAPLAQNLGDFLDLIRTDPAGFLYVRGCFTRYFDGETSIQWIPKEYVAHVPS